MERRDPPAGRLATSGLRQPPGFIIIGAQRAGTTSLYRHLTQHPRVGSAWRKEVHYFDRFFERGWDWYLAHFPKRGKFPVVGEASPYYMFDPAVPARVHEALPDVKLVALLRNPIDRAYSHHQLKIKRGKETLGFEEAADREPERLAGSDDPAGAAWRHYSYLSRGHYAEQLERWLELFPREQLMVIKSEDFYADPERLLHQTQAFLGVPEHTPEELRHHHLTEYETEIDAATRERLEAYFAAHNRRLYELLGRDLGWETER